jgi:TRAP-type mannitol/chloroaromatic compound transport system permease small subunit
MPFLLSLSRRIDGFTEFIGRWVAWLVLAAVLISATNAVVRKAFNIGSNAFLEIQWYLFAAVFLLAAGYTMMRQEHVRIDVISGRFPSARRSGSTSSESACSCSLSSS